MKPAIKCANLILFMFCLTPTARRSAASEPTTGLSLAIAASDGEAEYLPLIPIVVTMEIRNKSAFPRRVPFGGFGAQHFMNDGPLVAPFQFQVEAPDGVSGTWTLSDWMAWDYFGPGPTELLLPGEKKTLDCCLGFGVKDIPNRWIAPIEIYRLPARIFPAAGEYRIQLTMPSLGTSGLKSNVFAVSVRNPEGPADSLAYEILSQSPVPEVFLSPPVQGLIRGISPLTSWRSDTTGLSWFDMKRRVLEDTCPEIVRRCPDSAYAPYARLFLAKHRSTQYVQTGPGVESVPDVEKRLEAAALLRQCGDDPGLPRRYREAALEILIQTATELAEYERTRAIKVLPSIESILGVAVDNMRGKSPGPVYRKAHQLLVGAEGAEISYVSLQRVFTPEQIETLKAAVASNEVIQAALEVSPLQNELRDLAAWARSELAKLPWRDPNTGELRMKFSMQPGCL